MVEGELPSSRRPFFLLHQETCPQHDHDSSDLLVGGAMFPVLRENDLDAFEGLGNPFRGRTDADRHRSQSQTFVVSRADGIRQASTFTNIQEEATRCPSARAADFLPHASGLKDRLSRHLGWRRRRLRARAVAERNREP